MKKTKVLGIAVLLVLASIGGAVSAGWSIKSRSNTSDKLAPARAFHAIQIELRTDAQGYQTPHGVRICEVQADGRSSETWQGVARETQSFHTGNPMTGEYTMSDGKTSMALPTERQAQPDSLDRYRSARYLEKRGKTECIAGLTAYVQRSALPSQEGTWVEVAHAPETGPFYLRTVIHHPDGSEQRLETVSVQFK